MRAGPLGIGFKRDSRAAPFLQPWKDMATTAVNLNFDASGMMRTNFYCL